ncbi:MAG: hypothetical protein L6414_21785, partial [Hydrogenophaga sp.]|nr:hypothetical protein [Hydrogenophaga sp.]
MALAGHSSAKASLQPAGLPVLAITGRPAGWRAAFALGWPGNAIVAENGAVARSRGAGGGGDKAVR